VLACFLLAGCEEIVHLRIQAPTALDGAYVYIEGKTWGRLARKGDYAELVLAVAPEWEMRIVIVKAGFEPIVCMVKSRSYGRQTLRVDQAMIKQTK
jgi:hypothetical protein